MQLHCRIFVCSVLSLLWIGPAHAHTATSGSSRSLSVDRDPVPSIDPDGVEPTQAVPGPTPSVGQIGKDKTGPYTLEEHAWEVQLNVSVLDSNGRPAENLTKAAFHVFEDGVPQTITGFRHEDLAVSIEAIDLTTLPQCMTSATPWRKSSLDLVRLSNPERRKEFLVDFSSKAYIDRDFYFLDR